MMEILKTAISLLFLMISVYFVTKSIEKQTEPSQILIKLVAIILSTLTSLFVIDITVFYQQHSMRYESREKILQMIGALVTGLVAWVFYDNKNNKP